MVSTLTPGTPNTYTITVRNAGPAAAPDAYVTDVLPSALIGATWTCVASSGSVCGAAGTGSLAETFSLRAGGTATFTLIATVDQAATGTLSNTATVSTSASPQPGITPTDPTIENNSATDTNTVAPIVDLSVTITNGTDVIVFGSTVTYVVTVRNAGPSAAANTALTAVLPAGLTNIQWTCVASDSSSCTPSGSGSAVDLATVDTATVAANGTLTYTIVATISSYVSQTNVATATITAASAVSEPSLGNNTATDVDRFPYTLLVIPWTPLPTTSTVSDTPATSTTVASPVGSTATTVASPTPTPTLTPTPTTVAPGALALNDAATTTLPSGSSNPTTVAPVRTGSVNGKARLKGVLYSDANQNGRLDPGEAPLPGVTIVLRLKDGRTITVVTDSKGRYDIDGLEEGTYTVELLGLPVALQPHAPITITVKNGTSLRLDVPVRVLGEQNERGVDLVAFTGSEAAPLVTWAMVLLLAGLVLLVASRRRRRQL